MDFEKMIYERFKEAQDVKELDELIDYVNSVVSSAEDRVIEENDWWED